VIDRQITDLVNDEQRGMSEHSQSLLQSSGGLSLLAENVAIQPDGKIMLSGLARNNVDGIRFGPSESITREGVAASFSAATPAS
jgi:hypothetical protein